MESFEYRGYWWLPDKPEEQVPGTLEFDPDSGATLDLLGSFKDFGDLTTSLQPKLILGFSSDGKSITLRDCLEIRTKTSMPGMITTSFRAAVVFVGAHFERAEDVRFKRISVEFQYLDEWADISGFTLKMPYDPKSHPRVIEHKTPESVRASVGNTEISLRFRSSMRESNPMVREVSLIQKAHLAVEYPEDRSFDELSTVIHHLRNFLSLGVGEPVHPLEIWGESGTGVERPVDIYYKPVGVTNSAKKVHPAMMLFTFPDLSSSFEVFLGNWLGKAEVLEPVYQLYFGTVYNPRSYLHQQFLNLVQGLEAYHRRVLKTLELSEEDHRQRLKEILDAVSDKHRGWLEGKLSYSNEPSLRKRLIQIFQRDLESMKLVGGNSRKDRDNFVHKVVETRNYLTHFDWSKEKVAVQGGDLYRVTQQLRSMLEICLLHEIGFEGDDLKKILLRRRRS